MVLRNLYQLWAMQSLDIPWGIRSSSPNFMNKQNVFSLVQTGQLAVLTLSPIFSSGKLCPYINTKAFAVSAKFTRFHCSIKATRCRQFMQHSRSVFHNGGDGKHCAHAINHIYEGNKTSHHLYIRFKIEQCFNVTVKIDSCQVSAHCQVNYSQLFSNVKLTTVFKCYFDNYCNS